MQIKQTQIINGPQISDTLNLGVKGLDINGVGISGGRPGDVSYFTLYVQVSAIADEVASYDCIQNIGLYLKEVADYTGSYSSSEDLQRLKTYGDNGYGLKIKDPTTNSYSIVFNSSSSYYLIKKEHAIWYNTSNSSDPYEINSYGFANLKVSTYTPFNLTINSAVFTSPNFVGNRIYNVTKGNYAVVSSIVSTTKVILDRDLSWSLNDELKMEKIENGQDGTLATDESNAYLWGNIFKLEFQLSIPPNEQILNFKQVSLETSNI